MENPGNRWPILSRKKFPKIISGEGGILKTINPYFNDGVGFLIGGYGVLGTEAANYYFLKYAVNLGIQFGERCFGIIVRASITAGVGSTERLTTYDKVFE